MSRHSKVIAQTDKQTHTHTHTHTQYENITFPHTRAVIRATMNNFFFYGGQVLYLVPTNSSMANLSFKSSDLQKITKGLKYSTKTCGPVFTSENIQII